MNQSCISILGFLGVAMLTLGFRCNYAYVEPIPVFEYREKLTLTPYRKTYQVKDTIWVQFQTTDNSLFDNLSGKRVATDTSILQARFLSHNRYPVRGPKEVFGEITVENAPDVNALPVDAYYNGIVFKSACGSNPYFFQVRFVPKKTGVYSIEPHSEVVPCPGKSTLPYATFKFSFDLADCNKDVWLSIPPESRGGELGYTDVNIDNKEIFVLKVE